MNISTYIIPCLIVLLFIYACIKKTSPYNDFIDGAKESFTLIKGIFPYIIAIFFMIELFRISGLSKIFSSFLSPVFTIFGIPKELTELIIIKPFSGSGSLAILNEVYLTYGTDSYVGRCASVIMGSSETIFYISAVYFAKIKGKGLIKGILISLVATFISTIIGCLLCRIM